MTSDEDGFDAFFERAYPSARRLALRIVGSVPESEDLAAESFVKALVRWRRLRDLPNRDAWVLRVTANAAIDATRRRRTLPSYRVDADDPYEDSIARLGVVVALERLPRRQRDVVVLHHLVGLPLAEVADALGLSVNTVKRHLTRGRTGLRTLLDPQGENV